ncbi:MAG TPA: TonB-dependent receptor, partial [Bacteroidia bacterium]|nr:TonB-dependent receptor [Bacteroidia bacterium]
MVMITNFIYAQTGSIKGKVSDVSNSGLPGASVIIAGTTQGSVTDMDGNFEIKGVKAGTVNLTVSYIGFVAQTLNNVTITPGTEKIINVTLKENINQLQTTDIVAQRTTHTENAVLMEVKQSDQIVSGISNQQISKSQDRTASEVLKRIPGVTKRENGFIIIRGLDERYNVAYLNGTIAPSMEADKRAFDLDLIPSSMLDRLLVYKTGAPELPGDFTGGLIKVVTRNVSDEDEVQVSYTTAVRANTTFRDFYQAPKGDKDWLGKDDGTRSLPGGFPKSLYDVTSSEELTALGRQLPNAWTSAKIKAAPDQKFSASFVKNLKFGKVRAANITSVKYDFTYESASAENTSFNAFDPVKQRSDTIYNYQDDLYKENVRLSIIHNWSFLISPKSKLEFRNFFNQQGSNQTILREGSNYEEGSLVKSYAYRYQERTIYSGQLHGSHDLFAGRSKMEWTTGYSYAHSAEPDFRRIRTKKDITATSDTIPYQVIIAPSASIQDAGRYYSDLNEHTGTVTADFEHSLKPQSELLIPKLRAGFYTEAKQREFSARWMSYKQSKIGQFDNALMYLPLDQIFSSGNINDSTGFKLEEGTNPSDQYSASNVLLAGYVGTTWPFTEKITVSGGVRVEHNIQKLESRTYSNKKIVVDNPVTNVLPSLNASYNFSKKMLVRAAYFRSVNRPEFRELAPFSYYDFTFNNVLYGNPELLTATVHNYDVRWEYYPSVSELINFGFFYKDFSNPIEMFFVPGSGSGGTRNFTYSNAQNATSFGVEVEVKKNFISLFDTTGKDQGAFMRKFVSRTGVLFNAALIDSKVNLGDKAVGQSSNRPMMGQSPFIVNGGLFFSNVEKKFQVAAIYNIIGKRLFAVGTYGTPDIYYMPRNQIDLTISKGIGKYLEIKAGIQDLLAQKEEYKQDSNENGKIDSNDETVLSVKKGAYYSLGLNLKF